MIDIGISYKSGILPKDERIAILGAGATGITVARHFNRLGYTDVTILERENRVGGKCLTIDVDNRPQDMGAGMGVAYDYDHLMDLTNRLGIETQALDSKFRKFYDPESGKELKFQTFRQKLSTTAQLMKYLWLHKAVWKGVDRPDLTYASPELHATWRTVMEKRRLQEFSRTSRRFRTAFGYGHDDEIPALYGINYIRPKMILGGEFSKMRFFCWKGGAQRIWEKASLGLNIKTGVDIRQIDRSGKRVQIYTANDHEPMCFDKIVITFNPRRMLKILDASEKERMTYSLIRTIDYRTYLCELTMPACSGMPVLGYFEKNMRRINAGRPMFWAKRYPDRDMAVFTVNGKTEISDEQVLEKIGRDMRRIGGKLGRLISRQHWEHFPHVDTQALNDGFYKKMNYLQGINNTYVAGEILSFSTIARVMENAVSVAERISQNSFPGLM